MNNQPELPEDVLAAIHANRKIDAIKLLREHRGIGLKDAKQMVDRYVAANPQLISQKSPTGSSQMGVVVRIALVLLVAYLAYRLAL